MRPVTAYVLALALPSAGPALAADGPAGRYHIDVDATWRALEETEQATPRWREMLEKQRDVMFLVFSGNEFSLVAGPSLGGQRQGTCEWHLERDLLVFQNCRNAKGGAFAVNGIIRYVADDDTLMVEGNAPVPVRYRVD
ncbi:MAG: hypothetical protein PHS60_06570 [Zavarzinia sp.]|nr:hypothetical protein [Zavarzinia sp.]